MNGCVDRRLKMDRWKNVCIAWMARWMFEWMGK
jgi:hypothetical protein